jgi:hypothetical protein
MTPTLSCCHPVRCRSTFPPVVLLWATMSAAIPTMANIPTLPTYCSLNSSTLGSWLSGSHGLFVAKNFQLRLCFGCLLGSLKLEGLLMESTSALLPLPHPTHYSSSSCRFLKFRLVPPISLPNPSRRPCALMVALIVALVFPRSSFITAIKLSWSLSRRSACPYPI